MLNEPLQIFKSKTGQFIGVYDKKTKIFTKQVQQSKHLFRIHDAWGIQYFVIDYLLQYEGVRVIIKDVETGWVYETDFDNYLRYGKRYDYGDGEQSFLGRQHFSKKIE